MVFKLTLDGQLVGQYQSVTEAIEDTPGSPIALKTNIYACFRGTRETAGGYRWARTMEEVLAIRAELNRPQGTEDQEDYPPESQTIEFTEEGPTARCTGTLYNRDLQDLTEILKICKIDLQKWEVKRHSIKTWETTCKKRFTIDADTGMRWQEGVPIKRPVYEHEIVKETNTGFQVDLVLRSDYRDKLVEMLVNHVAKVSLPPMRRSPQQKNLLVELAIFDHHLGKNGFDVETLKPNWSIEQAMAEYRNVIRYALDQVDPDRVAKFLLPFGNDMIHVDSGYGTTTSGTRVADDTLWLILFRYMKEAIAQAVIDLSQIAPVDLEGIPGNHDQTSVLGVSEVILEMFRGNPDVRVSCDPRGRAWHQYGRNLLGYHHGDKIDPKKAHTVMISDVPHLLEKGQYRAVHVGHTHRSMRTEVVALNTLEESFGFDFEICPSLSPTDAWHDKNLYIGNLRRSKIFVYDYDKGLVGTHFYNIGR